MRKGWVVYNQEDDCYYSVDGKICGAEIAYYKRAYPPRFALSQGLETARGRWAIRVLIRELSKTGRK